MKEFLLVVGDGDLVLVVLFTVALLYGLKSDVITFIFLSESESYGDKLKSITGWRFDTEEDSLSSSELFSLGSY